MSYSGTGANRTPLGRLNPILLGRKRPSENEPSLISHHLRNREQGQPQPGYNQYDDYGQQDIQYGNRGGQQYDRSNSGFEQRGQYNQGQQPGFDQRGPTQGQYGQRGHQHVDQRPPQQFDTRGGHQYEQRGNQSYDNRGSMPYDGGMPGMNFEQRHGGPPAPQPQMYDMGQRSFQQANGGQGSAQRGPPPQPLMASSVVPPSQRPMAPPGHNGLLGMPPDMMSGTGATQNFTAPGLLSTPRPDAPPSYPDIKRDAQDSPARKKKKKSRWGDGEKKITVPGMPATMPKDMTEEQMKQYLMHFKIEEISMRLRTGDLGIPDNPEERSPSPEPIYNSEGKRLNTREFRVRKYLEEDRHNLIQEAMKCNPDYKPPADYKPPSTRIQEKVMIPQDANPAINFIGLLIGPRGNTLKKMEKETNCKIIIRGKGSVKEGKVGRAGMPLPGEDEPLHALVTGPTHEDVRKAVNTISRIIKEGIETPEGSNELRKMQLRELAALNGTLIEEDLIRCRNCGSNEHRHWECTEQKNVTHTVVCTKCGGHGHIASDCVMSGDENVTKAPSISERAKMDDEYMSLMAELGVDAPPPPVKQPGTGGMVSTPGKEMPPANRAPAPWNQNQANNQMGAWNYGKKEPAGSAQPPPLMSQAANPPPFPAKSGNWPGNNPGNPGQVVQSGSGQPGLGLQPGHAGMPQPLMSMQGHLSPSQPPQSQPPPTASQPIPPLMGAAGSAGNLTPGVPPTGPSVVPPPPGMAAPPPPPPSSSVAASSASAPVSQAPLPPWQTPLPPWQATPVPQDPMAAFMPMMYPPVAPPVGMTPPAAAPLPPWMAAPPPPPPPPPST